jgi:glycine cleavage system H protein
VTNVNEALNDAPEIVNESAEDSGWMALLELADPAEVKTLMTREQYDEYLRGLA